MDMEKLYDKLMQCEEIKDIPFIYIFRVVVAVFKIINSGECFYEREAL